MQFQFSNDALSYFIRAHEFASKRDYVGKTHFVHLEANGCIVATDSYCLACYSTPTPFSGQANVRCPELKKTHIKGEVTGTLDTETKTLTLSTGIVLPVLVNEEDYPRWRDILPKGDGHEETYKVAVSTEYLGLIAKNAGEEGVEMHVYGTFLPVTFTTRTGHLFLLMPRKEI